MTIVRFFFSLAVLSCFLLLGSPALLAGPDDPALRAKVIPAGQPLTAAHQPILALPLFGPASATLVAEAFQFAPTNYVWSQVLPVSSHLHAAKAAVTFGATSTSVPQTSVSFPERGIYELQVVATDGTTNASHSIWIQVWDRLSGLNPLQQIGRSPGIAPPTSVRQLSPDPGPYQHPRLLFSDADWPEFNAKSTASTDVASSLASLQTSLNSNFDKTTGSLRLYANALVTWSNGGFGSSAFTSSVLPVYNYSASSILCRDPGGQMPDALLAAAYLAWVRTNPALAQSAVPVSDQARFRYLAQVAAAAARAELTRAEIGASASPPVTPVPAHDMAVVYDLLYDWMTEAQRTDFRDYLYAIGYGYYNTGGGGIARNVQPTYSANGDFPNLADAVTLSALAIEGEEASVSPAIIAIHGPTAPVATGPDAWPHASPASVWNTYRMARWYSEYFITPWGSPLNHHAYLELSTGSSAGAMLAIARRGQNIFVTGNLYQASLHAFNNLNPRPSDGNMVLWDHHDSMGFGNGPNAYAGRYILRYMFPDDPLMDYVYASFRRENNNSFLTAVFHVDRATPSLSTVATAKQASLTRFDPFRGAAVTRNSWAENDLSLYFECRPDVQGHMHAEANNFSLYALGRAWASPSGYHITVNDAASTVLIQDPTLAADPATQGYIGQSGSSATTTTSRSQFPTPPAKFLEATEDPGGHWALFAGDATSAYQYAFERNGTNVNTGRRTASYYYGESRAQLYAGYDAAADNATLSASNLAYNPVQYALRSTLTVRGPRPYVLVMDDITTDGVTPRNFRWNMSAAVSFGGSGGRYVNALGQEVYSSMRIQPGSTATDAVLYHEADAVSGPRLLVRDLTEQSTSGQPSIFLDTRPSNHPGGALTYGYDNNSGTFTNFSSNRLLIPRLNVVSPKFKILLFPHQSGELTPLTSWNAAQTIATIDLRNGFTDHLTLDSTRADKRTRVTAFTRTKSGRAAPVLTLPGNITIAAVAATPAFTGQPGAVVTFSVAATSDTAASLTPSVSSPSGTIFPAGANTVFVTATDSEGQVSSGQFTVTVVPAGPVVTVTSATNFPGATDGVNLRWTPVTRATSYSVKHATTSGGPYTVVSERQTGLTFGEIGLPDAVYRYVVTAWFDDLEGAPSAEISLAPPVSGPFLGTQIGTAVSDTGVYRDGNNYLLTARSGNSGGSGDNVAYAYTPWTGDGSFIVRATSLTGFGANVSEFLNLGISLRASLASNAISALSGYTSHPAGPWLFSYRTATGGGSTSAGPGISGYQPLPLWFRATRVGNFVTAFYSYEGNTWTPMTAGTTLNLPPTCFVGFALGAQNTTLTSAVFDNIVFLGKPAVTTTATSATLDWSGATARSFSVQRGSSPAGPFTTIAEGLETTTYTDLAVSPGQVFYYTVTGISENGSSTVSPAVKGAITKINFNLPAPISATTDNAAGAPVTFSVTASDTIDGSLTPSVAPVSGSIFAPGTTQVMVTATNSNGIIATASFPVTVTLLAPQSPTNFTVTSGFTTNALTWSAATGAVNYLVRRATSVGGPYTLIATVPSGTTAYTDTGLVTGVTYFYKVSSINPTAESAATATTGGTPIPGTATKANNTTALDLGASWSTGTVPTPADAALWNGTYANGSVAIGSGLAVSRLQLTSPSQGITINSGTGPLALGSGGLDMSAATQNLTINAPVSLATSQSWNISSGRTLTVNAGVGESVANQGINLDGFGTIVLSGVNAFSGSLLMAPPAGGLTVYKYGGNNPSSYLKLTGGSSPGPITAQGRLDITGGLSNIGTLSGSGAIGLIYNSSTVGNIIRFSAGSSFSMFQIGANNASATLRQTGVGGVSFAYFGYNSASPGAVHTFDGGTWVINQIGQNNTGAQTSGTCTITNGANLTVTNGGFAHGTWNVTNGQMQFGSAVSEGNGSSTANATSLVFNVNNSGGAPGFLKFANTLTLADGGSATNTNSLVIGNGGTVQILPSGQLTLGSTTARTAENDTVTLQSGGKLILNGTLAAAATAAGQTRVFEWTGGQLTASVITAGAGFTSPASGGGLTATTLAQNSGTLAPGDVGIAGKTSITGAYSLGASGTLAIDLGGTTQATAFQTGQYDYLTVSGTTVLAGKLSVNLVSGFTPSNATPFTVVNSTGALTGGFSNVAAGQRVGTSGGEGSFLVSTASNKVTLSGYTALTPLQSWRFAYLGDINSPDTADPDGDGMANLMEYALGTLPNSAASMVAPVLATVADRLTLNFTRVRSDVTYIVEAGSNLATWTSLAINPGIVGQNVTVTDSVRISTANPPRRFLRLRVSNP